MEYVSGSTKVWAISMDGSSMWEGNVRNVADALIADTEDTPGVVPPDISERLDAMTEGDTLDVGVFTVTCRMVDKAWLESLPEFDGW